MGGQDSASAALPPHVGFSHRALFDAMEDGAAHDPRVF